MTWKTYPEYKGSGIEWLGEIPEHWEAKRLKYLSSVNDDVLPETTDSDFELLYVDISSVDADKGITTKEPMTFESAPSRARRKVHHGDVIVSTVRTYLRAIAPVVNPEQNLIVSTGFAIVRPKNEMDSQFAAYALRAPYFVDAVVANSVGVSYPAINASEMMCLTIVIPSLHEQRAIAAFLDRETALIDALINKINKSTGMLREYRTALITAAVTGKIDVRKEVS
jgi:type I restriction enzyme S subunit